MDRLIAHARLTAAAPREGLQLTVLMLFTLVVSSLDQCTRGPSLTCMVLTHLHELF